MKNKKLTTGCAGRVSLPEDYKSDSAMQQPTTKINVKQALQCPYDNKIKYKRISTH